MMEARKVSESFSSDSHQDASSSLKSLTHYSSQHRSSESPEWLKIDKLNFEGLSLFGRDQESDLLRESLDRLALESVERQLVLISGESGTGKTALANSLSGPTRKLRGLFVLGKYDFNNRHEPYSGIVQACVEICGRIVGLQEESLGLFEKVSGLVRDALGSELALMIKFVPDLKRVVDYRDDDNSVLVEGSSSEDAKNRFQFAFQRFIRIISQEFAPFILALDDLQWADRSSLDLLDVCLSDSEIKRIMVIGTYRSNEVDQAHILSDAIAGFTAKCEDIGLEMTQVSIENLDINAVNKIIALLLKLDDSATTMGLAEVCFKKTQGNPFFVLHFLLMLRTSGLLKFNYGSFSWNWNTDEIDSITSASSNVADVLKAKMAQLPKTALEILKIASCLGSTFDEECLKIIWENSSFVKLSGGNDGQDLTTCLAYLVEDGYIVRHYRQLSEVPSRFFSWTHDKIQEAAMTLIPIDDRSAFHLDAGDILLSKLSPAELQSTIFVVTNLFNVGEALVADDEKRFIIAHLNHDASIRALSISAFESVADYAKKGIQLLPKNHWNDHYELSLGLYSIGAQAEGFLGNSDLMQQYCDQVLSQKERPMKDKMWVYRTLVNSMIGKAQFDEANDLLLKILEIVNCRFPKNPVLIIAGVVKNAFKMKSIMKSVNLEALPKSDDPIMPELTRLVDRLCHCLYLTKDARLPLAIFRILEWAIKHGHTDFSSVGFALTGLILVAFQDFRGATWYGEHAVKLAEKYRSSGAYCRTCYIVLVFVFVWTKPLTQLFKPLVEAYNQGMQAGDQETAGYSRLFWLVLRYILGNALGPLEHDFQLLSRQVKAMGLNTQLIMTNCYHQAILNLLGPMHTNSMELKGEVISEETYKSYCQDNTLWPMVDMCEGILLTYFGDHVRIADTIIQHGHDYLEKAYPACVWIAFDTFLKGISCFAAASETGKWKYSRMAETLRSKIKKWRQMGNPNVIHYESFLDAESAILHSKKRDAIRYYEMTINLAGRTGFLQDAAFACERLAAFQLTVTGDKEEGAYRINQSITYWRDWGAMAKVEALEKNYHHLLPAPASTSIEITTPNQNAASIEITTPNQNENEQ